MRLGDLDALKEQFNHLEMVTNNSSIVEQAEYKMLMTCISLIDNAPTVEQKQGEWSFNPYDSCSYCSLCKAKAPFGYKNFCPECGADMRGGAE